MPEPLIAHVVGARPNFMKAAPVIAALESLEIEQHLIHTGQHYDENLSEVFFDELGLPRPDVNLGVGGGSQAGQTAALLVALETAFDDAHPAIVVVYGDVNSTLAASLVAAKLRVRHAHVEAGLRSFDRSMPEEVNRVVVDSLANLHYVTSEDAIEHLAHEGVSGDGVLFVGNPMIDTLLRFASRLDPEAVGRRLGLPTRYGVITLHRPSNVDDPATARGMVEALTTIAEDLPLVFPIHPRGRTALSSAGLEASERLVLVEPLPYTDFVALTSGAELVLTDSGGVQEETTVLGTPCLTLRDNTERPITITHGSNELVGTDRDEIVAAARRRLSLPRPDAQHPPLWDGSAGIRIAEDLVRRLD